MERHNCTSSNPVKRDLSGRVRSLNAMNHPGDDEELEQLNDTVLSLHIQRSRLSTWLFGTWFRRRPLGQQLKRFTPLQKSLNWEHPIVDYSNPFYNVNFNILWLMINSWSSRRFSRRPGSHSTQWTWYHHMSPEFSRFVEMVATSTTNKEWTSMIDDERARPYLVAAVMAKIIAIYVFSELLFGGTKEQIQHLKEQDRAMLSHDGYERSELRSKTIRRFLKPTNGKPVNFWSWVDKVAMQITTILLPLINNAVRPISYGHLTETHQEVHNIIAYAAWLSVCIRWSPTIIRLEWPLPGETYGSDMVDVSQEYFGFSKLKAQLSDLPTRLDKGKSPQRQARVHIAVIPGVRRFIPILEVLPESNMKDGKNRIYTITRQHALFYHGFSDEKMDREARGPTLSAIIRHKARKRIQWMVILVLVLLVLVLLTCIIFGVINIWEPVVKRLFETYSEFISPLTVSPPRQ